MKIRQELKDFIVEEISEIVPSQKEDKYKVYLLEKRGLETFSLLRYLARENKIPMGDFGLAGLKDRHAITKQYFTISSEYDIKTLKEKNFDITFLGYTCKKIGLGEMKGNNFSIIVRDIKRVKIDDAKKNAELIEKFGFPNYFDDQRFGSVIGNKFIAKFIIKNDHENAVKMYLTRYTKHENKELKNEKKIIFQNWNKISELKIKNKHLCSIIEVYKKTKNWEKAYEKIPRYLREMHFLAYQSYLWNECAKEILKEMIKKNLYAIKYTVGTLLFYKSIDEIRKLPLTFPMITADAKYSSYERKVIDKILLQEGVALKDFKGFRAHKRDIIVKPVDFKISEAAIDELNKKNKYKINLSFSLQSGSYATIVLKGIFE